MTIKLGDKGLFPYLEDYRPINLYKGENKIAGWKWAEQSGKELHFESTYNDFANVEIDGKSVQEGEPSTDSPIEIHSLDDFDVVSSVGGRNLLLNSDELNNPIGGSSYPIRNKELPAGEYTISFDYEVDPLGGEPATFLLYTDKNITIVPIEKNESGRVTHTFNLSETEVGKDLRLYSGHNAPQSRLNGVKFIELKLEKGNTATDWTPAPEEITENDNHPLIDKINLLLSEPLRSVGDVKDRLYRDSDGLWKVERNVELIYPEDGTRTVEETYGMLESPIYEQLSQEYQDKLNNLRSFRDSNYVYTVVENLKPTLHARLKVKDI